MDLDHLAAVGDWQLLNVPIESIVGSDVDRLTQFEHGTLVVWNRLDRLVGDVQVNNVRARQQFHKALGGRGACCHGVPSLHGGAEIRLHSDQ